MLYPSTDHAARRQPRRRLQPRALRPAAHTTILPQSWRQRAIRAYHAAERRAPTALQAELAERLARLTGQRIRPETIYANAAERLAVATVDGLLFRLRRDDLRLARPCVHCGVVQFESDPIASVADLGHALVAWEPTCPGCAPLDSDEWLFH